MDKNIKAMQILSNNIINLIDKKLGSATFCHLETGIVTEILDGNNYQVKINNKTWIAKSKLTLSVNDVVKILVSGKNYNDIYIIY